MADSGRGRGGNNSDPLEQPDAPPTSDEQKLGAITDAEPTARIQLLEEADHNQAGAAVNDEDNPEPPDLVLFNICAWLDMPRERSKAGLKKLLR